MVIGLVVGVINRDPQSIFGQAVFDSDQLPSKADRILFKVIAETEIAEHLEKRVMAGGVADIFQIVVLAAGAHAALRRGRAVVSAFVLAEEHIFELHHAGVGE